ncbi:MAG TPA: hypothetical protein VN446_09525 [Candidatus Acidoferrum sp.]|nr:hypothetical protein [Candidatus Acidoferrum sp.]
MERTIIPVGGMSCERCVRAVPTAVGALSGVAGVFCQAARKDGDRPVRAVASAPCPDKARN